MTLADYNSFDVALKLTLQAYLTSVTSIDFTSPDRFEETVSGWVNLVRVSYDQPQRIFSPFPTIPRSIYDIQIVLNLRGNSIETIDNDLLKSAEYTKGALVMLQLNGVTFSHRNYLAPTILKGLQILNYNRSIEAQAVGNQSDSNDKTFIGQANIACRYRL